MTQYWFCHLTETFCHKRTWQKHSATHERDRNNQIWNTYQATFVCWLVFAGINHKVAGSNLTTAMLPFGDWFTQPLLSTWQDEMAMWLISPLGWFRQHGLYVPRGVDMCAGLKQVWVRVIMYSAWSRINSWISTIYYYYILTYLLA
jgi:hypothetical protein